MTAADETVAAGFRPLLFSIAYGMTGSVGDAEDIVQDAFVGLVKARRAGTEIANPKAYLTTAVTRLGINHLGSARVRRESYVGQWLPEPIVIAEPVEGPAEHAELADSLSMAFLVLLEALSPVERAVFMLREVFGYGYPEVAKLIGKSEPNCRQIFARARGRIKASPAPPPARQEGAELAEKFFAATAGGDLEGLLELLAPDVVMVGDGGGKAQAVAAPQVGSLACARLLLGLARRFLKNGVTMRPAWVNGQPGGVYYNADQNVLAVMSLEIADGRVHAVRSVVNPDKLQRVGAK